MENLKVTLQTTEQEASKVSGLLIEIENWKQ